MQSLLKVDKTHVNGGMRWTLQHSAQSDSNVTNDDYNNNSNKKNNNNLYGPAHQLYSMVSEFNALVAQAHREIEMKTHGPNTKCSVNIATEV